MRPTALLLAIATAHGAGCAAQDTAHRATPPPERDGWRLVWHDEFDGDELDTGKWRVEYAALVKNQELQFYTDDEVYLEDGCLVLRSREREYGGREYTSGLVDTQHRFSQVFGRFEVRAKLPKGQGIWPAHWMLPEDHPSWPPEIDIMELLGHEPEVVHLTQHWGTWPNNASRGVPFSGPDFSEDFHTFAVEWSPGRIDWFVDEQLGFTSTGDIPQIPFYIILNTAVGGHWPGNPDETTEFPQYHHIDFVRVYERVNDQTPVLQTESQNGRVIVEPSRHVFEPGETVSVRAEADFGYRFAGWEDTDTANPTRELRMDGPRRVTALFEPDPALPARLTPVGADATTSETEWLGPQAAIDGRPGTRWSSEFSAPQELTIDLGEPAAVELVRVVWENAHPAEWELLVSDDGDAWERVFAGTKHDAAPDIIRGFDGPARYVRIRALDRATQWGISIWEVEVYGERSR